MLNLYSLGMEKGLLYETIVTTTNQDGTSNAAPIGVVCKYEDEVVLYLHEGSKTFDNVKREKSFHVNILKDPLIFVQSTIGNLDSSEFESHENGFSIKKAEAFFRAEVTHENVVQRQNHMGTSTQMVIRAKVQETVKIKKQIEPLNRAIYGIIGALIYLSRIDMVSEEEKKVNLDKINEISRVVNKVGGEDHKKAMKMILDSVENK